VRWIAAREQYIAVYLIYADRLDSQPHSPVGREGFTALSFSHALSDDRQSGMVTLQPGTRIIRVGVGDYERVRIFGENGALVGAMTRSPYGQVSWSTPVWTVLKQNREEPKPP
jgi:hypothetical protein